MAAALDLQARARAGFHQGVLGGGGFLHGGAGAIRSDDGLHAVEGVEGAIAGARRPHHPAVGENPAGAFHHETVLALGMAGLQEYKDHRQQDGGGNQRALPRGP